jgi:hypothetical protein
MSNDELTASQLSIGSTRSQDVDEDWDRSMTTSTVSIAQDDLQPETNSRNSTIVPVEDTSRTGTPPTGNELVGLLKRHGVKDAHLKLSADDASRLADVLGQWVRYRVLHVGYISYCFVEFPDVVFDFVQINSGSSPYEVDDNFFACCQDDLSTPDKRSDSNDCDPILSEGFTGPRPPSLEGVADT